MRKLPRTPAVYIIKNRITGEFYIGGTKNVRARWSMHRYELRHGKHGNSALQQAWGQYGQDEFTCSVLEDVRPGDRQALIEAEQKWLDHYSAGVNGRCYNREAKASIRPSYTHTKATRQRISRALAGKPLSEEHRAILSEAHKGKTLSAAHRAAIGRAVRGQKLPPRGEDFANKFRKLTPEQVQRVWDLYAAGLGAPSIARELGVGKATIRRILGGESYKGIGTPKKRDEAAAARRLGTRSKLTPEEVREMRALYEKGSSIASIARQFGVHHSAATKVVKRESYKWL